MYKISVDVRGCQEGQTVRLCETKQEQAGIVSDQTDVWGVRPHMYIEIQHYTATCDTDLDITHLSKYLHSMFMCHCIVAACHVQSHLWKLADKLLPRVVTSSSAHGSSIVAPSTTDTSVRTRNFTHTPTDSCTRSFGTSRLVSR